MTGIVDQLGLFSAAHPMRHLGRLQLHLRAQAAHGLRHLLHGGFQLRRTRQARPDAIGQIGQPLHGPFVFHGRVADARQSGRVLCVQRRYD